MYIGVITSEDWDRAAGEICPSCDRETLRLLPAGNTKVCPACAMKVEKRTDQEMEMIALLRSLRGSRHKQ